MTPKKFATFIRWDSTVNLVGFPDDVHASMHILGTIQSAVIAAHVKPVEEGGWHEDRFGIARRATFKFDYLGFRYELEGDYKNAGIHADTLEKIARVEESCEFSDDFAESMTIIVDDYRLARQPAEYGTW